MQIILLENAESQKKHYEKKCEDMAQRLRDTERILNNAQKEIANYQVSHREVQTRKLFFCVELTVRHCCKVLIVNFFPAKLLKTIDPSVDIKVKSVRSKKTVIKFLDYTFSLYIL